MKNFQKIAFTPYPELFTFLDRFCPLCGSPVSVKKVGELEVLVCTDSKCPYYRINEKREPERTTEC